MEKCTSLTIVLEAVTPLFLGGADPRGAPELRPPAFRGAMRYWLRAALGGVIGDDNLKALHDLESSVFGSTDFGSPIHVRSRPLDGEPQGNTEKILPHKEGKEAGSRKAIRAGQRFELTLSIPYHVSQEIWKAAIAALRLAVTFGGVGLRSRRGYGTLRVVGSTDPILLPASPTSLQGWKTFAQQTAEKPIKACRQLAQSQQVPVLDQPPNGPASFPCANKKGLIILCDLKASSAMNAVIQFMQKVPKDPAFGGIQPRQASPLWVRPIQTDENGYGLLFLVLASKLKTGTDSTKVQEFLDKHFKGKHLQAKGWNM
jgi:CRISPR-associated protein Cmr1